jgi:nucleoside-diphosphate-sugar epimerase
VHAAVTDGYLVIFEKDFKRNFIHVRDVADCFVHCLANGARMAGRPYNAGLDAANVSKEQLALLVQKHVPRFHVVFSEIDADPDKRNYVVSNQRLRDAGFEARRTLDDGIAELLRAYRMLPLDAFRNA